MTNSRLAFIEYPEDWIGKTIQVWPNGEATLDSSMSGRERVERGEVPIRTKIITVDSTPAEVRRFVDGIR